MRIIFTHSTWSDYLWFQDQNRKLVKRINQLIKETARSPFEGIGKPEPLKGDLAGRITHEHRMVYAATESDLVIIALRYHYND
jgi:toxin YoeB